MGAEQSTPRTGMGSQDSMVQVINDSVGILWVAGVVDSDLSQEIKGLCLLLRKSHEMYAEALVLGMLDSKVRTRLEILVDTSANLKKALPSGTTFYKTDRFYAKQEVQWVIRRLENSLTSIGKEFAEILAGLNGLSITLDIADRFKAIAGRPSTAGSFIAPYEGRYSKAVKKLTATLSSHPEGPLPPELVKKVEEVTAVKEAVGTALEEIRKIFSLPSVPTTPVA